MIRTNLIDFGNSVPSTVAMDENGDYIIFLNARLTFETLQFAYMHELSHIYNNDFEKNEDISVLEYFTHLSDL